MKKIIYILLPLFILCGTDSYGQFAKIKEIFAKKRKKNGPGKSGNYDAPGERDAFSGKGKGPNIYSSRAPRTKSKSKIYLHSTSKKRLKRNRRQPVFSSSKRRYKSLVSGPKSKESNNYQNSSGGRKSGKGRKKIK